MQTRRGSAATLVPAVGPQQPPRDERAERRDRDRGEGPAPATERPREGDREGRARRGADDVAHRVRAGAEVRVSRGRAPYDLGQDRPDYAHPEPDPDPQEDHRRGAPDD